MSNEILNRVWKDKIVKSARNRLLLVSLADQSNDDGICWPGINSLTKRTCCSRPTVIKGIKELEQLSAIEVYERHRKNHHYIIKVGMSDKQLEIARKSIKELTGINQFREPVEEKLSKDGFTQTLGKPDLTQLSKDGFTQVVKTGLPQPLINHQTEPSNNNIPAEPKLNDEKHLSPQQEMFGAICLVLKRNYKVRKKQTSNFAKQFIELGITPDEIKKFYGSDGWWYLIDWRGRLNQLPNEGAILDTFEAARDYYAENGDGGAAGDASILEDYFTELTGILPHPGGRAREDEWTRPCESFLNKAGDLDKAKKLMDDSFEIIRSSDKYKFSNPLSLLRTAMNLHAENGNGSTARQIEDEVGGYYV